MCYHHYIQNFFCGLSKVFKKGETYMDLYDEDEYSDNCQANLHYSFACQPEWEMASFLLKSDLCRGGNR